MGTKADEDKQQTGRVLMASNGDAEYMRRTKSATPLRFSMPKDSSLGDPVLIFTHEGLIGRSKVATKPKKDEKTPNFNNRPVWWGKIDSRSLELLPETKLDREVIDQMPDEWIWHKHPHRSFNTPSKEHFDKLEKIFDQALNKKAPRIASKKPAQDDDDVKAFEAEAAGYENDPAKRIAVEKHAMKLATEHYEAAGFEVKDISKEKLGYDLRCVGKKKEIHVEVKGTTANGAQVEVTINEVNHARMGECPCRTDLFVVSKIKVTKTKAGAIAFGGVKHVFEAWNPTDDDLKPIRFRYRVPT